VADPSSDRQQYVDGITGYDVKSECLDIIVKNKLSSVAEGKY